MPDPGGPFSGPSHVHAESSCIDAGCTEARLSDSITALPVSGPDWLARLRLRTLEPATTVIRRSSRRLRDNERSTPDRLASVTALLVGDKVDAQHAVASLAARVEPPMNVVVMSHWRIPLLDAMSLQTGYVRADELRAWAISTATRLGRDTSNQLALNIAATYIVFEGLWGWSLRRKLARLGISELVIAGKRMPHTNLGARVLMTGTGVKVTWAQDTSASLETELGQI